MPGPNSFLSVALQFSQSTATQGYAPTVPENATTVPSRHAASSFRVRPQPRLLSYNQSDPVFLFMMLRRVTLWGAPAIAISLLLSPLVVSSRRASAEVASADEEVTQHINLGKAFYENPTTQGEAVTEFKKALDLKPDSVREQLNYALALLRAAKTPQAIALLEKVQKEDPKLPHTWFNLGIYYKREGQFDKAIEQLSGMAKLVPSEAVTHYNLGTIYKLQNKTDLARKEFETSRDLNSSLAAPHFQLFNIYRQQGNMEDANRELGVFRERKQAQENDAIPKEDVEWCEYAEIYEPLVPEPDRSKAPVAFSLSPATLGDVPPGPSGVVTLDAFGTGEADLLVYTGAGIDLYKAGNQKVANSGLAGLKDVISVTPGDFNNDGLADLCILTASGPVLYENKKGTFAKASPALPSGDFAKAIWIDFDHDYDLDLVLLGKKSVLLRNQGAQGFVPHAFPFADGEALDGVAFRMVADTKSKDLLVTYKDKPATLYLDQLTAQYTAQPVSQIPAGATHLSSVDLDNDGNLDIVFDDAAGANRPTEKAARNQRTGFALPVDLGPAGGTFADLANRGFADYIAGGSVRQNVGGTSSSWAKAKSSKIRRQTGPRRTSTATGLWIWPRSLPITSSSFSPTKPRQRTIGCE